MRELNSRVYACDEVREVRRIHKDLLTDAFGQLPIRDQLDQQAQRILQAHQSSDRAVVSHVACWHPNLVGRSVEEIMSHDFTLDDARQTIAREYGFADWSDAEERGAEPPNPEFESAVDALLSGDIVTLRGLLERRPSLVRERSDYGHRSTLLHYVGSNGVETYRQVVPCNLVDITQLLVDSGADVQATAEMYGGGSTTIALLITSSHPAEAGVLDELVKVLLNAGAEAETS